MNLCIDQGNTHTKLAVFDKDLLVFKTAFENADWVSCEQSLDNFDIQSAIISSVANIHENLIHYLQKKQLFLIELNAQTKLPITNLYKTPDTLGKDRLAAVVGAQSLKPNQDILVVDIGTAITYDFIDASGNYHGGDITPGIDLRLKSLHEFTANLPWVTFNAEINFLGDDTISAIQSGVLYGIVSEIDGYIERLQDKYKELSVFLTGGSSVYFEKRLKSGIFANANLVLIGLNRILEYNVEN